MIYLRYVYKYTDCELSYKCGNKCQNSKLRSREESLKFKIISYLCTFMF